MTERDGGGVRGIGGSGWDRQPEQRLNHGDHLLLVRRPEPCDSRFHFVRRVLDHVAASAGGFGHHDARRLTNAHRRSDVDLEQHPLDGHDLGVHLVEERAHLALEFCQALRDRVRRRGRDHSQRNGACFSTLDRERAVPASRQPRVDAENEHVYDSSEGNESDERFRSSRQLPTTNSVNPTPSTDDHDVSLRDVTHRFGDITALDHLSFDVPRHQITVLLGPNGAGKTTAIRAITGALSPREGSITTLGVDPRVDGDDVRPRCGVVSAKPALYDRLSGYDNLLYSAQLYSVPKAEIPDRIQLAAARFGIDVALDHDVGGYSTGMKTRLALARSTLHDPELVLFDEPTSGLDPESAHAVLELIRDMSDAGRTVVMCTHLLAEAEGLADHIVVLEAGAALVCGSPADITRRYWPGDLVRFDAESPDQLDRMATWRGVVAYERRPGSPADVHLDGIGRIPELVADLVRDGVSLTRVEPHAPTLEDLYFAVRRAARGDGLAPVERGVVPTATEKLGASS